MDPALGVMSPFQREARGIDGMLEDAVEEITGASPITGYTSNALLDTVTADCSSAASASALPADAPAGTLCSFCSVSSTTRRLPKDGLYVCSGCVAKQDDVPRSFPLGTFKCCPTSTEGVDGDVVRCAGCYRWYHAHCVGITDCALRRYVTLSTTSWYCPEPSCCDRVLQKHLKRCAQELRDSFFMTASASCDFFYPVSNDHAQRTALHPTTVSAASAMENTSATPLEWMYGGSSLNSSDIEVWLHIHAEGRLPAAYGGGVFSLLSPTLLARCRLRFSCPPNTGALVRRSAAVFTHGTTTPNEMRCIFVCRDARTLSLYERVYQWKACQLHYAKERVLLAVDGIAPPHSVHFVTDNSLQSGLVVVQSVHHTYVFHLRSGPVVRDGFAPPIAALPTQWKVIREPQRRHVFQHGCLTESLVGLIWYDADRRASTFYLAALPLLSLSASSSFASDSQMRVLLELTTPPLHDADGDLVTACGLAQRLVYTRCALLRRHLQLSPLLLDDTTVVLEVEVEGAVSVEAGGTGGGVVWQLCGRQRYEGAVRRRQGTGAPDWFVEPLLKVWSRPIVAARDVATYSHDPYEFLPSVSTQILADYQLTCRPVTGACGEYGISVCTVPPHVYGVVATAVLAALALVVHRHTLQHVRVVSPSTVQLRTFFPRSPSSEIRPVDATASVRSSVNVRHHHLTVSVRPWSTEVSTLGEVPAVCGGGSVCGLMRLPLFFFLLAAVFCFVSLFPETVYVSIYTSVCELRRVTI